MLLIHKISPPYMDKHRPYKIELKPRGKYPTETPKFWLRVKMGWLVTWPIFHSQVELTRLSLDLNHFLNIKIKIIKNKIKRPYKLAIHSKC